MTNRVEEIFNDMSDRCEHIFVLSRLEAERDDDGESTEAFGMLVLDDVSGTLLAIEAGIDDEGMGIVTLRAFTGDCEPAEVPFVKLGTSVMITTR